MKTDFIEKAGKAMKKNKTVGAFTKKAEKAGMSVKEYATKTIKELKGNTNKDPKKVKLLRQALFANLMSKIKKK